MPAQRKGTSGKTTTKAPQTRLYHPAARKTVRIHGRITVDRPFTSRNLLRGLAHLVLTARPVLAQHLPRINSVAQDMDLSGVRIRGCASSSLGFAVSGDRKSTRLNSSHL